MEDKLKTELFERFAIEVESVVTSQEDTENNSHALVHKHLVFKYISKCLFFLWEPIHELLG